MSTIVRSRPRRPAWLYPVGTTVTTRDGRTYAVTTEPEAFWDDPTMGTGGGRWETRESARFWREVPT